MQRATRTWKRWILIALMILWIYIASSVLENTSSAALKYILLGGILAITEALAGISIAIGAIFPFALGLVFFGVLLSNIPFLHLGALNLPPDHWKLVVALAGCGMLISSRWINDIRERFPFFHGFKMLRPVTRDSGPDSRGQKVEITVRVARVDSSISPRRERIVRIRHPKKSLRNAEQCAESTSDGGVSKYNEPDHKLPFWVR
jgi:hypothetical protein